MIEQDFFSLSAPLDVLPDKGQMRAANLAGFSSIVHRLGGDPRRILARHDIDPRTCKDPDHFIECRSLADAFEYCSDTLNDPLFGLHLADAQDADIFGCITALCRAAPSVREALNCKIKYTPVIHSPQSMLELHEDGPVAELRWNVRSDVGSNDQANYQAALLNVKLLRVICGSNLNLKFVKMAVDARPAHLPAIQKIFGCNFAPRAEHNSIGFASSILQNPVSSSNKMLFSLLTSYFDRVKEITRTSVVDRVTDFINGSMSSSNCSIERCAQKLGTSVRTLQARLEEDNVTFSDLLERKRFEKASQLLRDLDKTLDDISMDLGYSEQTSFGRAFKRWTGVTPLQFRKKPH